MKIQGTIVFKKNWQAIHKPCETCSGSGFEENKSCSWCGSGEEGGAKGSGKFYKYIINEGSSRSSKTISLIDCFDAYARQNANKRLTVWRETKKLCKETVLNDALKRFRLTNRMGLGMILNKTDSKITYSNNSTFEIQGTDDEEKVHGFEQDACWLNEPYNISKETFDQLDMRTSDFVFIDWNPKKGHWIDDLKKHPRTLLIKSTYKDNPFCPPDQRNKIESYQPIDRCYMVEVLKMTASEVFAYDFEGNPDSISKSHLNEAKRCIRNENNKTANGFNWSVYGLGEKAEKPNRIFKDWRTISLEDYTKIDSEEYYAVDWGTVDPWAILAVKVYDGTVYARELNYDSENEIRAKMESGMLQAIDGNDEDEPESNNTGLVKWMFEVKLNIKEDAKIVCDTNRKMKIKALCHKFRAFPAVKNNLVDRISKLQELDIVVTSCSENLIMENQSYSWDVDRYNLTTEKPIDKDNHLIDCLGYITHFLISMRILKN